MRWLDEEERDAFGVDIVDELGAAMLTIMSGVGRDIPVVIASVWIDETGTGGDPRMLVGGIGAGALKWLGFSQEWQNLLDVAGVPHAHLYKMERNEPPFDDRDKWNVSRKAAFVRSQYTILNRWCQFGITVSLDQELYRDVYLKDFPKRVSPDSAYGLACKELILCTQRHCFDYFEDADQINFVIEDGHQNVRNVDHIFRDLKQCFAEQAASLGVLMRMTRDMGRPLQAIDHLVVTARRFEPIAKAKNAFHQVSENATYHDLVAAVPGDDTFPTFYHELTKERLLWHREHKAEMTKILRRQKNARKNELRRRA